MYEGRPDLQLAYLTGFYRCARIAVRLMVELSHLACKKRRYLDEKGAEYMFGKFDEMARKEIRSW